MNRQEIISQLFDTMDIAKRSMHGHFQAVMQGSDLTRPQLELLFSIKHHDGPTSRELATYLHVSPGAVSQILEGLDEQQLIERQIDPSDRRRQVLRVSASGKAVIKRIETRRRQMMERVMQGLSDDELLVWLAIQRKIISEFKVMHQVKTTTPTTERT